VKYIIVLRKACGLCERFDECSKKGIATEDSPTCPAFSLRPDLKKYEVSPLDIPRDEVDRYPVLEYEKLSEEAYALGDPDTGALFEKLAEKEARKYPKR